MATTAKWGSFEWGAAEWGSIEESDDLAASGSITLDGAASLQLEASLNAVGPLLITGTGALTAEILMAAAGSLVLNGSAALKAARFAGRLQDCGAPLSTFCQDWLLEHGELPE